MLPIFKLHKAQQECLNWSYETKIERLLVLTVISPRYTTCMHQEFLVPLKILCLNCVCGVGMCADQGQWEWSHGQNGRQEERSVVLRGSPRPQAFCWVVCAHLRVLVPAILFLPDFSPLCALLHFALYLSPAAQFSLLPIFISLYLLLKRRKQNSKRKMSYRE